MRGFIKAVLNVFTHCWDVCGGGRWGRWGERQLFLLVHSLSGLEGTCLDLLEMSAHLPETLGPNFRLSEWVGLSIVPLGRGE